MTFMGYARNCVQTYAFDYVQNLGDICTGLCDSLVTKFYTRLPVMTNSNKRQDKSDTNSTLPSCKGLTDRPRDEARRIHELLQAEYLQVEREYRHLRGVVDQLRREYDDSKDVDCFRRYGLLKRMIKRTVVHLKLEMDDNSQSCMSLFSLSKLREDVRQRETRQSSLSAQEICMESDELREQIKEHRRKVALIRELVRRMETSYDAAKHQFVLHRYAGMKVMVKTVICNQWI